MSALHRNALLDDDAALLPINSEEVLRLYQTIRRRDPQYTDEMNLLIDTLDGPVSEAIDKALADYWRATGTVRS